MVDFMILIWFWYGWFFVLWLCHRNLMFSVTPTTAIPKAPSPIPSCAMVFFLGPSFLRVWAPRPHACYAAPRTNTEPRSPRSSRILNPGIWTAVMLSHKHRKIKSYISVSVIRVWLASSPLGHVGSFWEVLAHRSEKPEKGKKVRGSWLGCLWF